MLWERGKGGKGRTFAVLKQRRKGLKSSSDLKEKERIQVCCPVTKREMVGKETSLLPSVKESNGREGDQFVAQGQRGKW